MTVEQKLAATDDSSYQDCAAAGSAGLGRALATSLMMADEPLRVNRFLMSCSDTFRMVMQNDRNLVTYRYTHNGGSVADSESAIWALNFADRALPPDANACDPTFQGDPLATYARYEVVPADPASCSIHVCQVSHLPARPEMCTRYVAHELQLKYDRACINAYRVGISADIRHLCGALRLDSSGHLTATPRNDALRHLSTYR
jgi:hypothetical protein